MFDPKFYSFLYPELKKKGIKKYKQLQKHWNEIGKLQGFIGYHVDEKIFNWKYYIAHNNLKMIVFNERDAIKHWYNIGKHSGLKCNDLGILKENDQKHLYNGYNSDDSLTELEMHYNDEINTLTPDIINDIEPANQNRNNNKVENIEDNSSYSVHNIAYDTNRINILETEISNEPKIIENNELENVESNEHGNVENNEHGNVENNEHGNIENVESNEIESIESNEFESIESNEHGNVENNEHGNLENNEHGNIENVESNEIENVENNEHGNVENNEHGNIENVESNEIENVESNEIENVESNEIESIENNEHKNVESNEIENIENHEIENIENHEIENVENNEHGNVERNEIESIERNEIESIESNEIENIENNEHGNVESNEIENVESNEIENVESNEIENVESNEHSNVENTEHGNVENNEIVKITNYGTEIENSGEEIIDCIRVEAVDINENESISENQLTENNNKLKQEIMETEHTKLHKVHSLCIKKKEFEKLESQLYSIKQILINKEQEINTFDLKIVFTKLALSILSLKYDDTKECYTKKKQEMENEKNLFIKIEKEYNSIREKLFLENEINRQKQKNYEKQLEDIESIKNNIDDQKKKNIIEEEKCNSLKIQKDNLEKIIKNHENKNKELYEESIKLEELLIQNNEIAFKLNEENKNQKTMNKKKLEEIAEIEKIIKDREKENIKFLKESDEYICRLEKSQEELLEITNLKMKKEKEKLESKENILNKYNKKLEKLETIHKEYSDKIQELDNESEKISEKINLHHTQIEEYKCNQTILIDKIQEKKNEYLEKNKISEKYVEELLIQKQGSEDLLKSTIKENEELNNNIEKINSNIKDLQLEIENKKILVENSNDNYKKLDEEMQSLKEITITLSESIKNIEQEYYKLEEQIIIFKNQRSELEQEYFRKNSNKLESEGNIEKLKDELHSFNNTIHELEESISKSEIEREEIITLLTKNKHIINTNKEKLENINLEIEELKLSCKEEEICNKKLNLKILESENWNDNFKKQKEFSNFQNYILKNKLKNLEDNNKKNLSNLLDKNRIYEFYNKKLLTIDKDYEITKKNLISQINLIEINNKKLLVQNESTQKNINSYLQKLITINTNKQTIQIDNNILKKELNVVRKKYTACCLYLIILKQEGKYLRNEIESLSVHNNLETIKSKNIKIKLGELNDKINNLNTEKKKLESEIKHLQKSIKLIDIEIYKDIDLIDKKRIQLNNYQSEIDKLRIKNTELKNSKKIILEEEETERVLKNNLLQNNDSLSKLLLEVQEQIIKIKNEKKLKENINTHLVAQIELYDYENEELENSIENLNNSINKNKNYLSIIFNKNKELNTKLYTHEIKSQNIKNDIEEKPVKVQQVNEPEIKKIKEKKKIKEEKINEEKIKEEKIKLEEKRNTDTLKNKFEEMHVITTNFPNSIINTVNVKYKFERNPLINILTRTSNRPNYFSENRYTVMMQTYRNIRQIVSVDNKYSLNYIKANNVNIEDIVITEKKSRLNNKHMPYNLYCNTLLDRVKSGWIMFLDDDDILNNEHVIESIIPHLDDENNILIWRCLRGDKLYPGESFGKKIKKYDIGSNSFIFHSKYKHLAKWDDLEAADYRCLVNLTQNKNLKIVWVNKIISKINNINPDLGKGLMIDKPFKNLSKQNYLQIMYINRVNSELFPSLNLEYTEYIEESVNKCIESYFDKIYILNLERRNDRWEKIKNRLNQCGINNYIRYIAVDGKLKFYQDKYNNYLKLPFNEYDIKFKRKAIPSSGSYAILLSMYSLFTDALKKKYNKILVLQDDIILHKNFQYDFEKKMEYIPRNWKLLYLGANQREWNTINIQKNYYIPNKTDGAFAVGYDISIYRKILKEIQLMKAPFDSGPLQKIQEKYNKNCYVLYPNIIIADLRDSDCRNSRNMVEWSKKLKWNLSDFDYKNLNNDKLIKNKKLLKPIPEQTVSEKQKSKETTQNKNIITNDKGKKYINDLVSIIVTSYNCEKYIYHTLISLISQSYKNIEILIIDDDSTDNTMDILRQFVKKDKRIKVIRNDKNYGTYISKNIGIKYAKGEFITFNDADDISISKRIEEQVNFMKLNKTYSGCVCGFFSRSKKKLSMAEITLFIKRDLINEIGYFESVRVGADTEFRKRIEICGYKIHFIKKYLYSCLDRFIENSIGKETSLTRQKRGGINSNIRNLYRKYFTYFHDVLKKNNSLKYMAFPLITRKYDIRYQNTEDKLYMEPKLTEVMRKHIENL